MNQEEVYKYAICYSQIKHPLYNEKKELKNKYIDLMGYFAKKYCPNSEMINIRLKTLRAAMFEENIEIKNEFNYKNLAGNVLKTRFSPFRFFSYRYLFLFDCLLLFAADNPKTGQKICDELKKSINERYYNGLDMMVHAWNDIISYIHSSNRNITFTATMSAGMMIKRALTGIDLSENDKKACENYVDIFLREELTLGTYYPVIDYHEISDSEHLNTLDINIEKVWEAYLNTGLPGFEWTIYEIVKEER